MQANDQDKQAVLATLDRYSQLYAAHDVDGIIALFAPDADTVVIGTGADERYLGLDAIRGLFQRNFAESDTADVKWTWRHVVIVGSAAWVAAEADIHVRPSGVETIVPVRWTVIMEKRGERWLWLHRHASVAASGQAMGKAYPTE